MFNLKQLLEERLEKAKYSKRWKGKDGKWKYLYNRPKKASQRAKKEPTSDSKGKSGSLVGKPETSVPEVPMAIDVFISKDKTLGDKKDRIENKRISDLLERIGNSRSAKFVSSTGEYAITISPSSREVGKFRVSFWQAKDGNLIKPSAHDIVDDMKEGVESALGLNMKYSAMQGAWDWKLTEMRKSIYFKTFRRKNKWL